MLYTQKIRNKTIEVWNIASNELTIILQFFL